MNEDEKDLEILMAEELLKRLDEAAPIAYDQNGVEFLNEIANRVLASYPDLKRNLLIAAGYKFVIDIMLDAAKEKEKENKNE
jgi:hypothetical protein